jgi:hypothetical protein
MNTFSINPKISLDILRRYKNFLKETETSGDYQPDKFTTLYRTESRKLKTSLLKKMLEETFKASVEKEEGKHHSFSVIISPPENKFSELLKTYVNKRYRSEFGNVQSFTKSLPISMLSKIAPAFESTNQKLRIWFNEKDEIEIWGFANNYFDDFGLEIVTFSEGQIFVQINLPVLTHSRFLISQKQSEEIILDYFSIINHLFFGKESFEKLRNMTINDLHKEEFLRLEHRKKRLYDFAIDLINKINKHAHGGILLVIPDEKIDEILEESIKSPINFDLETNYNLVKGKLKWEEDQIVNSQIRREKTSERFNFNNEINFIAQLTAIDGATIITKSFDIVGFGAKIKPKTTSDALKLETVLIREPFEESNDERKALSDLGGTRHQSTAQFVFDQREKNAFAIVASQDGKISIIFWDDEKQITTVFRHLEYLFYGMKLLYK